MTYVLYFLIVISVFIWILQPGSAEEQWYAFENKMFYVDNGNGINFNNSEAACSARNANLLVITSLRQNQFIREKLENNIRRKYWLNLKAPTLLCSCLHNIGDVCTQCRESWQWRDGTEMTYWNWSDGKPQGYRRCSYIYGGPNGDWDDTSCSNERIQLDIFRYVCQYTCISGTCANHTCTFSGQTYTCQCPSGKTGVHCDTDINECTMQPCEHDGICINSIGSYSCNCTNEFMGMHCGDDFNECDLNPCQNNGTCQNSFGSYNCTCDDEYEGPVCERILATEPPKEIDCEGLDCLSIQMLRIVLAATAVIAGLTWIGAGGCAFMDYRKKKQLEEQALVWHGAQKDADETGFHNIALTSKD